MFLNINTLLETSLFPFFYYFNSFLCLVSFRVFPVLCLVGLERVPEQSRSFLPMHGAKNYTQNLEYVLKKYVKNIPFVQAGDDPVPAGEPAEADGQAARGGGAPVPHGESHGLAGNYGGGGSSASRRELWPGRLCCQQVDLFYDLRFN